MKHTSGLRIWLFVFVLLPAMLLVSFQLKHSRVLYDIVVQELLLFGFFALLCYACDYIGVLLLRLMMELGMGTCYACDYVGVIALRLIVGISMGSFYFYMYLLIGYRFVTGAEFNPRFLTDNVDILFPTLLRLAGPVTLITIATITILMWLSSVLISEWCVASIANLREKFDPSWHSPIIALFMLYLIGTRGLHGFLPADAAEKGAQSPEMVELLFSMFPAPPQPMESVFYVQLESGNASLTTQKRTINGEEFSGNYAPVMQRVAKDGVYFPLFWSNSVRTNRAQENILCDIANNVQDPLSRRPEHILNAEHCLPALLRAKGYRTIMFRGADLEFENTREFMLRIGFDEVHGPDIMLPGSGEHAWGFDDCSVYQSAFRYLWDHRKSKEKLFVYIEVSSHHENFQESEEEKAEAYDYLFPFPAPKNDIEHYLNSYATQDSCIQTFYDEYRNFTQGNAHLFIAPDHSVPVWGHDGQPFDPNGSYPENFLINLAYIPPKSRVAEFRIGEEESTRFSETDILPTVLELLGGEHSPRSFLSALQKNPSLPIDTHRCQILTQPYAGPDIVIVKGLQFFRYSLKKRSLILFNLETDPLALHPITLSEDMPYETFHDNYQCKDVTEKFVSIFRPTVV